MSGLRQRPGDQPLPVRTEGPGMHDLLIADLHATGSPEWVPLADELAKRRDVGLERYGAPLQEGNGRDALHDLLEELLDGMAYARQARREGAFSAIPDDGAALENVICATASAVLELIGRREHHG